MNLALVGLAPAGGSQTLSVDFLQLFPHDNGMRVCPAALMPDGTHVMVDSGNQLAGALLPTGELRLPMVEGNGLWLLPGTAHRLYLLQGSGDFPGWGSRPGESQLPSARLGCVRRVCGSNYSHAPISRYPSLIRTPGKCRN